MSQQPPPGKRVGSPQPPRLPHHISSVAHVFFSEDEAAAASNGPRANRHHAITCFGDGRIAAYACAGLVCGARTVGPDGHVSGVELVEDPDLIWSAGSYLPPEQPGGDRKDSANGAELARWTWPLPTAAAERWWRWTHLRAFADADLANLEILSGTMRFAPRGWHTATAGPAQHGLVICLFAREVSLWVTAFRLGRLVTLLAPPRLEILVFPDCWTTDWPGGRRSRLRAQRPLEPQGDLIARGGDLARAVADACPVVVTALPECGGTGGQESPGLILRRIAFRLATDF